MLTKWLANLRASADFDFAGTGVVDSQITGYGQGLATLVDSTGKITYKPNNVLLQSNNFTNAAWTADGATVVAGASDPNGGTSAFTVTAVSGAKQIYQLATQSNLTTTLLNSVWIRRRTGTGTVSLKTPNGLATTDITATLTTDWQRLASATSLANSGSAIFPGVVLGTVGDAVDIFQFQTEFVTYETTPRPYNATTASPYYGPRINYDPATLARLGLRVEEQRINIALQSALASGWAVSNTTFGAATTAPDGTATARAVLETATTAAHNIHQTVSLVGGTTYAMTIYAKPIGRDWVWVDLYDITGGADHGGFSNITTGAVGGVLVGGGGTVLKPAAAGNGYYRIGYIFTPVTTGSYDVSIGCGTADGTGSYAGDITKGAYMSSVQIEAVSANYPGPTSYIPTGASAVTRLADAPVVSDISQIYNQLEGAIAVTCTPPGDYNQFGLPIIVATNASNYQLLIKGNNGVSAAGKRWSLQVFSGGAAQAIISQAVDGAAVTAKLAASYAANDFAFDAEGAVVGTVGAGTVPTVSALYIGNSLGISNWFNGDIGRVRLFKKKPNSAQLLALAA